MSSVAEGYAISDKANIDMTALEEICPLHPNFKRRRYDWPILTPRRVTTMYAYP